MSSTLGNLFRDLQRRRVFKAAAIYVAVAWVLVQVIDVVGPYLFGDAADRIMRWVVAIAIAGFPATLLLAWRFDITPDGVRRTTPGSATGVFAIVASIAMLVAGTAGFVWIMPQPSGRDIIADVGVIADSVAVMPFTDLSPDKTDAHFTDGIAAVLIHKLSPVGQLTVFAIDSTLQLRGENPRAVRQKLGAARLLSGTVQRSGTRLRISTWLVDTQSGKTLWSEQFDRANQDVFAIQDEIALAVAKQLGSSLDAKVRDRVTAPLTDDLDAYDLYLLAIQSLRNTPLDEGNAEGIALLEAAVEKDPDFALGWAALASTVFWHASRGYMPWEEGLRLSDEYLTTALELNPELSEAHSHATVRAGLFGDLESARASFEKAIEYGPSNARAYMELSVALRNAQQFSEALAAASKGVELDPINPDPWLHFNIGFAHLGLGNYDTGMQHLGKSYLRFKGTGLAGQSLDWLAIGAIEAGRYDEAIAAHSIALRDGHDSIRARGLLAQALVVLGDAENAAEVVAPAETTVAQQRAEGRAMNVPFWKVEVARLYLDLTTSDIQHQLATAKFYTRLADSGQEDDDFYTFTAAFLNTMLGRHKDAARMSDRLLDLGAHDPENYAFAIFAHRQLGDDETVNQYRDAGRKIADEYMAMQHPEVGHLLTVALFRAVDEQHNAAIDLLQQLYDDHRYIDHINITYTPLFDDLRSDPRYLELLRQMREDAEQMRERVDAARASGDWESLIAQHLEAGTRS